MDIRPEWNYLIPDTSEPLSPDDEAFLASFNETFGDWTIVNDANKDQIQRLVDRHQLAVFPKISIPDRKPQTLVYHPDHCLHCTFCIRLPQIAIRYLMGTTQRAPRSATEEKKIRAIRTLIEDLILKDPNANKKDVALMLNLHTYGSVLLLSIPEFLIGDLISILHDIGCHEILNNNMEEFFDRPVDDRKYLGFYYRVSPESIVYQCTLCGQTQKTHDETIAPVCTLCHYTMIKT